MPTYTDAETSFTLKDQPDGEAVYKFAIALDRYKEQYTHQHFAAMCYALAAQETGAITAQSFPTLTPKTDNRLLSWVGVKCIEWYNNAFNIPNA